MYQHHVRTVTLNAYGDAGGLKDDGVRVAGERPYGRDSEAGLEEGTATHARRIVRRWLTEDHR